MMGYGATIFCCQGILTSFPNHLWSVTNLECWSLIHVTAIHYTPDPEIILCLTRTAGVAFCSCRISLAPLIIPFISDCRILGYLPKCSCSKQIPTTVLADWRKQYYFLCHCIFIIKCILCRIEHYLLIVRLCDLWLLLKFSSVNFHKLHIINKQDNQ